MIVTYAYSADMNHQCAPLIPIKIFVKNKQFRPIIHRKIDTACLSGAAKLARRQRGEKKFGPRQRGRKLEHRAARSQRG